VIRLALGGGGVRGFFHLGLLRALDESGVRVTALAGSSAGAVAAAVHAFGLPLEVEPVLKALNDPALARIARPGNGGLGAARTGALFLKSLRKPALADNETMRRGLLKLFGDRRIEEAIRPLAIVASDLLTGEMVVIRSGSVVEALLASGSIPGLFPPVRWNGRYLVDGDVAEKVPVSALKGLGGGMVVAVDISNPPPTSPPKNGLETALLAGDASRRRLKELALSQADRVVRIPLTQPIDTFDFGRVKELYQMGLDAGRRLAARLPRRRFLWGWWKAPKQERKQTGAEKSGAG